MTRERGASGENPGQYLARTLANRSRLISGRIAHPIGSSLENTSAGRHQAADGLLACRNQTPDRTDRAVYSDFAGLGIAAGAGASSARCFAASPSISRIASRIFGSACSSRQLLLARHVVYPPSACWSGGAM